MLPVPADCYSTNPSVATESAVGATVTSAMLKVVMDGNYPPYIFRDSGGG